MAAQVKHTYRLDALKYVLDRVADAQSVSIVGVSNIGKSQLLRDICNAEVRTRLRPEINSDLHFFYIDCNRMLDQTELAFYELVLRVLIAELHGAAPELLQELQQAYEAVINPRSDFHIPLSFNQALTVLIEHHQKRSVLVFDEFDTAYAELNPRVFLNLRAIKDRYQQALVYVTATDRRLSQIRLGVQLDEFKELFGPRVYYVRPLDEDDGHTLIDNLVQDLDASFDEEDINFILEQAGGHPALVEIVCRRLAEVTGEPARSESANWLIHREVRSLLHEDFTVASECRKIWRDLSVGEQQALGAFFQPGESGHSRDYDELKRRGVLLRNGEEPQFFSALFEEYTLRRNAAQHGIEMGIHVDADSGEVTVDGHPTEILTNLEYRLLLLLYGHINKIIGKFEIVEAVWGEDYIDTVYDSSIEKLVSRLRQKIEPNPASPRFITTVRGRGYKLVG